MFCCLSISPAVFSVFSVFLHTCKKIAKEKSKLPELLTTIMNRGWKWAGHVARMNDGLGWAEVAKDRTEWPNMEEAFILQWTPDGSPNDDDDDEDDIHACNI